MAIPNLPSQGSTSWFSWAQALDATVRQLQNDVAVLAGTGGNTGGGTTDPGTTNPGTGGGTTTPPVTDTTIPSTAQTAPSSAFVVTGSWDSGNNGEVYTHDTTATAKLTFTGSYVELFGIADTYHTSIGVQIDSGTVITVSEQSNTRDTARSVFKTSGLSSGTHTLTVTVLATADGTAATATVLQARVAGFTAPAGSDAGGTTPPATTTPVAGFVQRDTNSVGLTLNGKPYKFVGFNAVNMLGPTNGTRQITDDAAYYKNVAYGMTDRVWALPGCDLSRLDRIVQAAKANGSRLIVTLFDALGAGGPKWSTLTSSFGSYQGHLSTIVTKYKDEPAIAAWEIANEPPQDRANFDKIGGAIKAIDPVHLVSTGTLAVYNDADVPKFANAGASPYVDILSMHEYDSLVQGPSYHLARILSTASSLKKPIFIGEFGIDANVGGTGTGGTAPGNGVTSFAGRGKLLQQKTDGYLSKAEVCGVAYWSIGQNSIGSQADSYMALNESIGINAMKVASAKWSKNGN
jgi:hypothetical protein